MLFANETGLAPDILTQLSVVGPDGRFLGSNLDADGTKNRGLDLSGREHIRVHLLPGSVPDGSLQMTASGLFVGKPVLGVVSGRWTVQLSRPLLDQDGAPAGVVVASLNPDYFDKVYGDVDIGPQGVVALMGSDFTLRSRVVGGRADGIGQAVDFPPGHPLHDTSRTQGTYQRVSHLDGLERITAFHRVLGYPLSVVVSTTNDAALDEWKTMRCLLYTSPSPRD